MKNVFYLLAIPIFLVSFGACNSNTSDDAWKEANISAYDAIVKDPSYHALQTETGPSGVYYKVLQSGTGTEHPFQTSSVTVLYQGSYYDGTVFDAGTSNNDVPATFALGGQSTIRGFSFAMQQMVVGDKWEIWIPYYLGYGASGYQVTDPYTYTYQTVIKGYTTLVFQVELVSITLYP